MCKGKSKCNSCQISSMSKISGKMARRKKTNVQSFIMNAGTLFAGYLGAKFLGTYIPGGNYVTGGGKIAAGVLTTGAVKGTTGTMLGLGMGLSGVQDVVEPLVAGTGLLGSGGAIALNGIRSVQRETTEQNSYDAQVASAGGGL